MTQVNMIDGMNLADLREAAGMNRQQVGTAMGVTRQRVGQIELAYPNLHFTVVSSYLKAIGGEVNFVVPGMMTVSADSIEQDTSRQEMRERRKLRVQTLKTAS